MLRQELQTYLDSVYPFPTIDSEHSLCGRISITFDLHESHESELSDNATSATERSFIIFNDLFDNPDNILWLLVYEYVEDSFFPSTDYLYKQFSPEGSTEFYNKTEIINSRSFIPDTELLEKVEAKILVGKLSIKDINVKNILNGIANRENGLEPIISQSVYFFEPKEKVGFHMYDDRGCYIWSDDPNRIRHIYKERIKWINEFAIEDIKEFFT